MSLFPATRGVPFGRTTARYLPPTAQATALLGGAKDVCVGKDARTKAFAAALKNRLNTDQAAAEQGVLHPWCQSFLGASTHGPTQAVVLLLHGFTAGPWQFDAVAERLTGIGMDVYAPRLPGHGCLKNNVPDARHLPGLNDNDVYSQFAEQVLQEAKAYAKEKRVPLYVMGFSLGGGMALDIASHHPHSVKRLMLGAPLVKPQPLQGRLAFQLARLVNMVSPGRKLLRRKRLAWDMPIPKEFAQMPLPGYFTFPIDKMCGCLQYARRMRKQLRPPSMPVQLVVTEADKQCDPKLAQRLIARSPADHFTYTIDKALKVSHVDLADVMVDRPPRMTEVACRFLQSGKGTEGRLSEDTPYAPPPRRIARWRRFGVK